MDCGAFACGLALDLLVCGIGAAFCGVCAVRDEVLSFAWGVSGFFEEVVGGREALTLTGIIVGLRLEWGGFGYALAVRLFRRCLEVRLVRK